MIRKVLIANRGEIALRIVRACQELGVRSVAVYSDADAQAPHVREADEAVHIGPAPASESYLRGDHLIAVAKQVGADAIHPGYGFLSEREWFARAVRDAGLIWIGPPAEAIAAMGSKTAARTLAISAGTPVVPGTTTPLRDAGEAAATAAQFGYPVLLKAAAGGGGKGMRVVREAGEIASALASAQREAKNAFGDDAVYVEKYIEGPRHVEIQVLADAHGNCIALGERECSIQRRHQKMVEEAPSVAVSPELRKRMGDAAVAAAKAAGYVNAGTCEFLLDKNGDFYFLEMNTRIQVEHPVTELVMGIDLVQWQLRIASGERLPVLESPQPKGWAIECRITSEDPANGFLPSTGRIAHLHLPSGPGVRWDGGIEVGSVVGLSYDPMLAKLIVFAPTREAAIARMERALKELVIDGVETSREFHLRVMADADYRAGRVDIQWLESRLPTLLAQQAPAETRAAAAIAAALLADRERGGRRVAATPEGTASVASTSTSPAGTTGRAGGSSTWAQLARLESLRS
ncbi:MAG: acetyl-CoA carboxylase biotin carboxylase subunit [Gemmatimonadaceae bacterium]|nr:acetyl-CoA carboxylase biotin carboxylase subunit [Gemmatimonadaceae bacterium]